MSLVGKAALKGADALGFVGSAVEMGVGIAQLVDGVKKNDRKKRIKGMLNIGIGIAWAAGSTIMGGPVGSAVFIALTGMKMAYLNKDKILAKGKQMLDTIILRHEKSHKEKASPQASRVPIRIEQIEEPKEAALKV